jgi:hypothetical protein
MDDMLAFNVPIEGLHTETGPGVYEAAIGFSEALEQADRAILFKTGTQGDRRALRHHAQLHGQAAPACRAAAATSTRACRTARPTCSLTPRRRAR